MMSTVFLYVAVGVLMPLLGRSIDPPPLPHTGVQLYGGYNNISYPNNSMIPANHFHRDDPNSDGLNDALWCQSAKNEPNIGVWYYPSGTQVSTVDDSSPLHSVHKSGQIGLYRDYGLNNLEGIYTCVIPDEHNINQTLTIALYKLYTYKFNRGPKIIETTFKSLLSTRDDSSFLISFNVTDGTATYINCTLNDTLIYPNITQIILSYQLPIKILVELVFQSRDEGWYNCSVSNSRVKDKQYDKVYPAHTSINVKVAGKPINVTAKWINSSDVLVTWSPPVNSNLMIDGYEVFYGVNDSTFSVGVTNYTELIISGLYSTQNYSFFVVSYSNEEHTVPSEWSNITTLIAVNELTPSSVSETILSSILTSSIGINDVTTLITVTMSSVNEIMSPSTSTSSVGINNVTKLISVTPSSVSETILSSILTSSIGINDVATLIMVTMSSVNEIMSPSTLTSSVGNNNVTKLISVTPSSVKGTMLSSILTSSVGNNNVTKLITVNEVTSSVINEIMMSSTLTSSTRINRATSSSNNEITTIVKPSPSSQLSESSQVSSSWVIIGVGFLFFAILIIVIVVIITCLWLLRSRRKHKKIDTQMEYTGQYLSSKDGTTVESEFYDKNLLLRDEGNEEDINPYASHVYAVVNKKDKSGSSIYSITTAAKKNDEEMLVHYQEVIM